MEEKVYDKILYAEIAGHQKFYQTKPHTLGDFYSGSKSIAIPDYQRPYSWKESNVSELLQDIKKIQDNEEDSWFIGSLFLLTSAGPNNSVMLLDGQQRSTTIQLIALAALKRCIVLQGEASRRQLELLDRSLKSILVNNELKSKFRPIDVVAPMYFELVENWVLCETEDEFLHEEVKFQRSCNKSAQETGYRTASTLVKNFKLILRWFEGVEDFEGLQQFCSAFLNRTWLIQIPMQDDAETVKIFEGLNNRGKPLSLVDKLRFRCLIVEGLRTEDREKIKGEWGELFKLFSRLENSHLIKTEDDFFKVFFNAIDGEGRDKNEEFFEQFDKLFATREGVFLFLKKTKTLLDVFVGIEYPNDENNSIIRTINNTKKEAARSFLHVLYSMIRCSSNSRFLVAKSIYDQETSNINLESLLTDCWEILKIVVRREIGERAPSNEIRPEYLDKCKNSSTESFQEQLKVNHGCVVEGLKNFVFHEGSQQNKARLLLTIYAFNSTPRALTIFTQKEIRKAEVDHFIPRAWKQNWIECAKISKQEVINEIKLHSIEFEALDIGGLVNALEQSEVHLEFKDYTTLPHSKEKQVLELIGNRWLLSEKINKSSSNGDFITKKAAYQSIGHRIPSDTDVIGILQYDPFTWRDACKRSLILMQNIKRCLEKDSWLPS